LLTVGFEDWRARPLTSVEGKGGMFGSFRGTEVLLAVVVVWFRGRVGDRLVSLESEVVPCALKVERMRSVNDGESGEVFFIDVETKHEWEVFQDGSGGLVLELELDCRWAWGEDEEGWMDFEGCVGTKK
jgi:hypothetical protein